jgi:hypothetical protein
LHMHGSVGCAAMGAPPPNDGSLASAIEMSQGGLRSVLRGECMRGNAQVSVDAGMTAQSRDCSGSARVAHSRCVGAVREVIVSLARENPIGPQPRRRRCSRQFVAGLVWYLTSAMVRERILLSGRPAQATLHCSGLVTRMRHRGST